MFGSRLWVFGFRGTSQRCCRSLKAVCGEYCLRADQFCRTDLALYGTVPANPLVEEARSDHSEQYRVLCEIWFGKATIVLTGYRLAGV